VKKSKFKTQKCWHFDNGWCLRTKFCYFAHGDADIKTDVQKTKEGKKTKKVKALVAKE
jgi:hypothetical protein